MQQPLFTPPTNWSLPHSFPVLQPQERVAIDLETNDPELKQFGPGGVRGVGHVAGIAVATSGGYKAYFPYNHLQGNQLDRKRVLRFIQNLLDNARLVVGHNLPYDLEWLRHEGVTVKAPIHCTQVCEALIDENLMSYSLDKCGERRLGTKKDELLLREASAAFGLKDPKAEMWKLPPQFVGPYAEQDAQLALDLADWQLKEVKKQELERVYDVEMKLVKVLQKVRHRGIRVDLDRAEQLMVEYNSQKKTSMRQIKDLLGFEIDPWSGVDLKKAYDKLSIPYSRTAKGNPSFPANWLEAQEDVLSQNILMWRSLDRMGGTFVQKNVIYFAQNGRIHANFKQTRDNEGGTGTGRLSMNMPNLQQIPARNPRFLRDIRGLFLPEPGFDWLAADYSQQEPRWMIELAYKLGLGGASEAMHEFCSDSSTDYHSMVARMAGIDRKPAKTLNLGLTYGMGKAKLTQNLGVTPDQAEEIFNKYHTALPYVSQLSKRAAHRAGTVGYVKTYLGRRRRFHLWEPANASWDAQISAQPYEKAQQLVQDPHSKAWYNSPLRRVGTHKALNAIIQGSSADQTKLAMVIADEENIPLQLTVHDEIGTGMATPSEQEQLQKIMSECVDAKIPFKVDMDKGINWGDAA